MPTIQKKPLDTPYNEEEAQYYLNLWGYTTAEQTFWLGMFNILNNRSARSNQKYIVNGLMSTALITRDSAPQYIENNIIYWNKPPLSVPGVPITTFQSIITYFINDPNSYTQFNNPIQINDAVSFLGSDLTRSRYTADEDGVSLFDTDFGSTILTNVTFSEGVNLESCNFNLAGLNNTTFAGPMYQLTFQGTTINNCRFDIVRSSNFDNSHILAGTTFSDLEDSSFNSAILEQVTFTDNLSQCDFIGTHFSGTPFNPGITLHACHFRAILVSDLSFKDCHFTGLNTFLECAGEIDFSGTTHQGTSITASVLAANFQDASISTAIFLDADMTDSNFSNATLSFVTIQSPDTTNPIVWLRIIARNTQFINCDLSGMSLLLGNLSGAKLLGQNGNNCILPSKITGSNLQNAEFVHVMLSSYSPNDAGILDSDLSHASISSTGFIRCNFKRNRCSGASLNVVAFDSQSVVTGNDLSNALIENTQFACDLHNNTWTDTRLLSVTLQNLYIEDTLFNGTQIEGGVWQQVTAGPGVAFFGAGINQLQIIDSALQNATVSAESPSTMSNSTITRSTICSSECNSTEICLDNTPGIIASDNVIDCSPPPTTTITTTTSTTTTTPPPTTTTDITTVTTLPLTTTATRPTVEPMSTLAIGLIAGGVTAALICIILFVGYCMHRYQQAKKAQDPEQGHLLHSSPAEALAVNAEPLQDEGARNDSGFSCC